MRNGFLRLVLVALVVGGFSTQTFSMAEKPKSLQVSGKIAEVNLRALTIKVAPKNGEPVLIHLDKKTVLTKADKKISLPALKKDDLVTVSYRAKWGKKIALSISVKEQPIVPKKVPTSQPKRKQ